MSEEKKSFQHILKATSLFGGVQVFQILINLIRSKFVAYYLGPVGMGISGLFLSTTNMIGSITGLGLSFSAVRNISQANDTNDLNAISHTIIIFRRWIWLSSILGVVVTIFFAPTLSQFTFGNKEYTWSFIWLSSILLLNSLTNGNIALLQGTRRLKDIAKSTVVGAIIGLFTAIPLFYFYGNKGIVPSLIIAALTVYLTSSYFTKKIEVKPITVLYKDTVTEGREMVKLGVIMMASVFIGNLVTYLVNTYVNNCGGVADVGLYQAGISITSQYVGLVFSAMGVDYFPRLSAISSDNNKVREMVNQQAEIVVLIVAPLLIGLMITAPLIVKLLLTPKFYAIIPFVRLVALGMLFKAASYAVGYISFAKGDKKFFFIVEGVLGNLLTLILSVYFYHFFGINGIGISFIISYSTYFILILIVTKHRYLFTFNLKFIKIFVLQFVFCLFTFIVTLFLNTICMYFIVWFLFVFSLVYSIKQIDKRIDLKSMYKDQVSKIENKKSL